MIDHVIALSHDSVAELRADWYKLHRLLYAAIGNRVSADAGQQTTNWTYAIDPRAIAHDPDDLGRHILVRTRPELEDAIRPLRIHAADTYVPEQGETVRFFLNVSSKRGRSFDFVKASLKTLSNTEESEERHPLETVHGDTVQHFIVASGLELIGTIAGPWRRSFVFSKGFRKVVPKQALIASGVATVIDVEKTKTTLAQGIGRDRALGFGMLVLESEQNH